MDLAGNLFEKALTGGKGKAHLQQLARQSVTAALA
jgi:hypothetical protein